MSIEAMERWLEALEIGLEYARGEQFENARRYAGYERMAPDDAFSVKQIEDAIVSLRQAINQAQVASNDTSQERVDETAKQRHKPLTDEEMYLAIRPLFKTDALATAALRMSKDEYRAVEAKLKEKNT